MKQQQDGDITDSSSLTRELVDKFSYHFSHNGFADAGKIALAITQCSPEEPIGWKMLGAVLAQIGRLDESLVTTELAARLAPNDAEVHNNLGAVQLQLGMATEAVVSHEKAIALQPNNAVSYCNLGNALRAQGKLKAAEENFKKSISLAPGRAETHYNLAGLLRDLGRLEQAECLYTKTIELAPENASAVLGRWEVRFDREDFDNALKDAESHNTDAFKACALETLFALGRDDEVQSRLIAQEITNSRNLRISAFSSFFSAQTRRKVPNHFCENPMELIYFSNISSHVKEPTKFISELTKELSNIKVIWEPSGKSTKGGFQTPEGTNLFKDPSGNIQKLNDLVRLEVDNYVKIFKDQTCGFIQDWPPEANFSAWCVSLQPQGYQKPHIHPEGWLSGVIYLKVTPRREGNEGAIEFGLSGSRYSSPDLPTVIHKPAPGDVVLFPSSLHHKTIPFTTETERVIVSFDLIPSRSSVE